MKSGIAAIICIVGLLLTQGASAQEHRDGGKVLLGPITIEQLIDFPDWFGVDFMTYMPAPVFANELPGAMNDVDILCILGTWCDDSKREVPRLIRLMQMKGIDPAKLRMVGADRNKMSPGGETAQYKVEKVPTFIFLREGLEVGRIVEAPETSLERNMLAILQPDAPVLQVQKKTADEPAPPPVPEPILPKDEAAPADGAVK